MSKYVELAALGLGGASLFAVSFVGFAAASDTPMSEVALIGPLFADDDEAELATEAPRPAPDSVARPTERSDKDVMESQLGVLASYPLAPSTSDESYQALVDELKARKLELDMREADVEARETVVQEQTDTVTEQFETLDRMRQRLEEFEQELLLRETEVVGSETARDERQAAAYQKTAELFKSGDIDSQSTKLLEFSSGDAAKILGYLSADRVRSLLEALPADRWKEYADAYADLGV